MALFQTANENKIELREERGRGEMIERKELSIN